MATMKDVARLANVSLSTVSHVVNGSRFVSKEITQRVQKVIVDLDYKPSSVARSLKVKETNTLGMLVTASNNPFFSEVVHHVERYCERNHYHLILVNTEANQHRFQKHLERLLHKQIDGLLLMCSEPQDFEPDIMSHIRLPKVIIDWWKQPLNADIIHENSEFGGYLATKALIDAGYQRIAVITGERSKPLAENRLKGYKRAMAEHHLQICSEWIIESHFHYDGGVAAMNTLLSLSPRPDAVFIMSDSMAVGAYQAIWRAGLNIPRDIAVIGYDNIEISQYLCPPLSTIHQPKARLAKMAVERLIARIQDPTKPIETIQLSPELIKRESF